MPISPEGLEAIKQAEGSRRDPATGKHTIYVDPVGRVTIGYGHALTSAEIKSGKFKDGLTEQEATALLAADVTEAEKAVTDLVKVSLNQNQFDALVDFTYNVGRGRLAKSTLLQKLNSGDYAAVPAELARWNKGVDPKTGKLVALPGLTARRAAERLRFAAPEPGHDLAPHDLAPHDLTPHDLTPHDREPHDREPHDRTPHDLTPHDLTPHDLTPHDLTPHDLTPHGRTPHDLSPHALLG